MRILAVGRRALASSSPLPAKRSLVACVVLTAIALGSPFGPDSSSPSAPAPSASNISPSVADLPSGAVDSPPDPSPTRTPERPSTSPPTSFAFPRQPQPQPQPRPHLTPPRTATRRTVAGYPYPHESDPTAPDPWGMAKRQCVSYVAWWLNAGNIPMATTMVGPARTVAFGDAATWDVSARSAGFEVSSRPSIGAIAQWRGGEGSRAVLSGRWQRIHADRHGHVAVVLAVLKDGSVRWADYNFANSRNLHVMQGTAPRYISFVASAR